MRTTNLNTMNLTLVMNNTLCIRPRTGFDLLKLVS